MTIQAGVGLSFLADPVKAALEASDMAMGDSGLVRADMAIFFCTYPHATQLKEMSNEIARVTAAKEIAGCTGYGIIAGSQEVEQSNALSVLVIASDLMKGKSFFVQPQPKSEPQTAQKIVNESRPGNVAQNVAIMFPDFSQMHPELLMNAMRKLAPEDIWVGGCPSGDRSSDSTYQAANGQAGTHAISGMYLSGNFHHVIGVAQGAIPIGKTYTITQSKENCILTLDDKTAYEALVELAKAHPLPVSQDPNSWIFMALSSASDKEPLAREGFFVRNILGVDPKRGLIAVAANIKEGQRVSFAIRDPAMAKEDLRNVLKRIKRDLPSPIKFGLYFNCCARGKSLYQTGGVDTAIIEEALGTFPLAGFFTFGEIGPMLGSSLLHNYSGVLFLACD